MPPMHRPFPSAPDSDAWATAICGAKLTWMLADVPLLPPYAHPQFHAMLLTAISRPSCELAIDPRRYRSFTALNRTTH